MNLRKLMNRWSQLGRLVRYDFSNVRDNIIMAMEEVMADGYRTFVGKVKAEYKSSACTNLTIIVMARNSDGSNTTYTASQDFYSLINVPGFVSDALIYNHCYEVVLTMDDMRTIYHDRIMELNTSNKTLAQVVIDKLHRMGIHGCNVKANIYDIGIYYRVEVYEEFMSSSPVVTLLTLPVNGLEQKEWERLHSVHNLQILIPGV